MLGTRGHLGPKVLLGFIWRVQSARDLDMAFSLSKLCICLIPSSIETAHAQAVLYPSSGMHHDDQLWWGFQEVRTCMSICWLLDGANIGYQQSTRSSLLAGAIMMCTLAFGASKVHWDELLFWRCLVPEILLKAGALHVVTLGAISHCNCSGVFKWQHFCRPCL